MDKVIGQKRVPLLSVKASVKPGDRRFLFSSLFLATVVATVVFFSCTQSGKREASAGPNVILISIDTLRADHLRAYGYEKIETPNIDALANEGVLFKKTYAHAPITLPSHTSILTGTYPNFHGVRNNGEFRASEKLTTAAEIFKSAGYGTAAFVGAFVMDSRFGLDQGFDLYDDDMTGEGKIRAQFVYKERSAGAVVKRATDWLEKRLEKRSGSPPFFIFLHLFDPHMIYDPPEPFRSRYSDNPYDGEIAYADSQVGVFLEKLKELKLYDNTLIVLTSDHGESLGEHGEGTHAIFIYNATIWVPLVIKLPDGQNAGAVIERMTRHIDILPTMVDIAGIGEKVPHEMKSDMHGVSLTAFINGEGGDGQDIRLLSYAESYYPKLYYGWAAPVSIRAEGYEYIDLPINEFYDLETDPSELNNIYEKSGERAEKYALKLEEIKKKYGRGETGDARRSMDRETLQKLKSLGYIHGDAGVSFSDGKINGKVDGKGGERGKDPKTVIEIAGKLEKMENLMQERNYPRVMELGEKALDSDPENIHILFMLAQSNVETGDTKKAVLLYETIKELYPRYVPAYVGLLDIYTLKEKKFDAAQKELNTAFAVAPGDPTLWIAKGNLDMKKGDLREAEQSFLKALGMGEQSESLFVGLAGLYAIEGKFKKAEEFFLKAIRVNFGYAHAHHGLGLLYEAVNRHGDDDAEKEYRLAIGFDGNNPKYFLSLGTLLARQKEHEEAAAFLEKAVAIAPDYHEALQNLGTVYMETGNLHKAEQLLKKAVGLKPGMAHAYVSLAGTYLKMGDTEKAFSVFHKITKVAPEMPLPWYQMALIAAAGKRNNEAQKYLKKAIEKGGPQVAAEASNDAVLKEFVKKLK